LLFISDWIQKFICVQSEEPKIKIILIKKNNIKIELKKVIQNWKKSKFKKFFGKILLKLVKFLLKTLNLFLYHNLDTTNFKKIKQDISSNKKKKEKILLVKKINGITFIILIIEKK
jgi:hypothetical protein